MKALALVSKGKLKIINKKTPSIKEAHGAILAPILVTPCTSDVNTIFHGGKKIKNLVMGHECIARVEKTGRSIKKIKKGDLVLVGSISPNWDDKNVNINRSHAGPHFSGHQLGNKIDGCFAEKFYLPHLEKNVVKINKNLNFLSILMCADMMPTAYTGIKALDLKMGESLCIYGIGAVGLCAILIAKSIGIKNIYAIGGRSHNINLAKLYGARVINYKKCKTKLPKNLDKRSNSTNSKVVNEILKLTKGVGVDKVLICGGPASTISEACDIVKYGTGKIVNLAGFNEDKIYIPKFSIGKGMAGKEIKFLLSDGGSDILKKAISLSKNMPLDDLVTYYDLDESASIEDKLSAIYDSIMIMKEKPDGIIKIAIPINH